MLSLSLFLPTIIIVATISSFLFRILLHLSLRWLLSLLFLFPSLFFLPASGQFNLVVVRSLVACAPNERVNLELLKRLFNMATTLTTKRSLFHKSFNNFESHR